MKIMFVWPSAENSIYDVGLGYRAALEGLGCDIYDWKLFSRLKFMAKALDFEISNLDVPVWESKQVQQISWHASRMLTEDVIDFVPDWVVIISGMGFHPIGLEYMKRLGVPVAVIFTESPYNEEHEKYFADLCELAASNERTTALRQNWLWLPPAMDPNRHNNAQVSNEFEMDVAMVGTGWEERIQRLMSVDWTGIDLRLFGVWPQLSTSPNLVEMRAAAGLKQDDIALAKLGPHYYEHIAANWETAAIYARAKICLNDHRNLNAEDAVTYNPRCIEVLAVGGGLLLTDWREDLVDLLGDRAREFSYRNNEELSAKIHYYLSHEAERKELVNYGRQCVQTETFDVRAAKLLDAMRECQLERTTGKILATMA